MTNDRRGILLALGAAGISGVSVFVNSYGVRAAGDATVYTTAKNLVAALILLAAAAAVSLAQPRPEPVPERYGRRRLLVLGLIGVIGGSVPFVLFFEGLARATSGPVQAQFLNKTLVVWVVLLAVPLLHERVGLVQVLAITLLMAGQMALSGGFAAVWRMRLGTGELLIVLATLLWAIEVILAKHLLRSVPARTVAVARMVLGSLLLLGWLAVSGRLPGLWTLDGEGRAWALLTGVLLAGYVTTWLAALRNASAVLVTSLLVAAVPVTALLQATAKGALPPSADVGGLAVLAGCGLLLLTARRPAASVLPAGRA